MATKLDNFFGFLIGLCVVILVVVILSSVCHAEGTESRSAEWEPAGFNTWKDGNHYVTDMGRLPQNYQKPDSTWEEIDTTWQSVGDTLFQCKKAVVTAEAWPDGVSEVQVSLKNHTVTLKQTLDRLVFVDTVTWNHQNLMVDIPLSNFIHSGRDLSWTFPGGEFRIRKDFGCIAHQIEFKPVLLDSVSALFNAMPPAARNRVALGTVFKYEITGIDDTVFLNHPRVTWKRLARLGEKFLDLSPQILHFPEYDTLPNIPVFQEWKKIGDDFYLCEYVMMKHIDTVHTIFPDYTVWHAATTIIGGETLIEDTWIENSNTCYNYGGNDDILIKNASGDIWTGLMRCWDVSGQLPANATVTACTAFVNVNTVNTAGDVDIHRILKPWVEGTKTGSIPAAADSGATWLQYDGHAFRATCQGRYWADAGALCYRDADDNDYGWSSAMTCEDSTADVHSITLDSRTVSSIGFVGFEVGATLGQAWYDGTDEENGVIFVASPVDGTNIRLSSIEKTYTPNSPDPRPYFRFDYTVAAAGQVILID